MTYNAKRRLYLLGLASATCFLLATLLYDLIVSGIFTSVIFVLCGILMFAGCVLSLYALETWAFPDDYASKDTNEEQVISNYYAITFYIVAVAMILAAGFLLAWTVTRSLPIIRESGIIAFALLVAGSCVLIGRQATK
jgi:archaellum biogenesis protein FlaJ (TadC family)